MACRPLTPPRPYTPDVKSFGRFAGRRGASVPVTIVAAATTVVLLVAVVVIAVWRRGEETTDLADELAGSEATATATATSLAGPTPTPDPSATPEPSATPASGDGPVVVGSNPPPGSGQWEYAGAGPTLGYAGPIWTYRVAVEVGLPVSLSEFTALVDATLGDPRGWTGAGERRFQRVAGTANFTVYLASPWTAYQLCRSVVDIRIGGVPYTNCQAGAPVVINSDRYLYGASAFTGSLDVYRRYVINHEVGHRLGRGHVNCRGAGQLADVMQQQTLGMQGCLPNAWPYPHNPAPPPPPDPSPSPEPSPEPSQSPEPDDSGDSGDEP